MIQQTSEATEEVATSSEEPLVVMEAISSSENALSEIAESLQRLVTQFKLNSLMKS